ncbi:MAG: hypothetical protein HYR70_07510 [Chloroflexi bacterium]|nr:hypothetical protein [Chloroflexota bacterium]MBI3341405.1 hypothetical protein [Chloroflexota bacterium]
MDEKRIQEVLKIEKQAQEIYDAALREADQLPVAASQEAQALLDKTRAEAEAEARRLVANAEAKEECARILIEAEEKTNRTRGLAMSHLERAVGYVLDRVAGRE